MRFLFEGLSERRIVMNSIRKERKKRHLVFLCAGLLCFASYGCATIVSGSSQSLTVTTEKGVEDASCELTDAKGGKWYVPSTPGFVTVRKGDGPMTAICKKDGYRVGKAMVDETLAGATLGNVLLGGGIGILVDATSGAAQEYPNEVIVWMEPLEWKSEKERIVWFEEKEAYEKTVREEETETAVDEEDY